MSKVLTGFGQHIAERGWRYARFVREFSQIAAELRLDVHPPGRRQFDRWRVQGKLKTQPHDEACQILERLFPGRSVTDLFTRPDGETAPTPTTEAVPIRASARPEHDRLSAADVLQEEDDMKRRTMLLGLTASGALGFADDTTTVMALARQRMDAALEASTVSPATLERWETTAYGYARSYQRVPPQQLLGDALADLFEVHRLLEGRHRLEHRRRLCRIASHLATLCGVFSSALGEHREARGWFHTGCLAAQESGDTQLVGNLEVRSAILSLYYGSPGLAYEQALHAQAVLGNTFGPALARALVVQARALARMGRADQTLPAIRQAEEVFSHLTDEDRRDMILGFTERQFHFTMGNALTHMGRSREASAVQQKALAAYAPGEHLDPTLTRLDQALCLVHDGDTEEAYHHAGRTLQALPREHRTGMVISYAKSLARAAERRHAGLPAGREFTELLHA